MSEERVQPWQLRGLLMVLGALFLAVLVWFPMIWGYPNSPEGDGRYFFHSLEVTRASLVYYHELPLWNPYDCGGVPHWDAPEVFAGSPIVWLTTGMTGPTRLYFWNIWHVVIGMIGAWLLARDDVKLSRFASFAAAALYTFATCQVCQYCGGHSALISFYYVPLLLLLWRKAEKSADAAVGLGLVVAVMMFDGATYPLPHSMLLLAAETLMRMQSRERVKNILKAAAIAGGVAFVIGAARLLPLAAQFSAHKREIEPDTDHLLRLNTLWSMYFGRDTRWWMHLEGQQYVNGEYIAYMGVIAMALAFVGMLLAGWENAWLVALAIFVLSLMLGHFATWAPWAILKGHIWPFTAMRVPARFRLILCLFIALFVGIAVDKVPQRIAKWLKRPSAEGIARVAVVCLAIFAAGDVASLDTSLVETRFLGVPPAIKLERSTRLFYEGPNTAEFIDQPRQNRGRLACSSGWAFYHGADLWSGDVPQARAARGSGAIVEVANRTQNTFTIDVDVKEPNSIVLVNSNYDHGWRSDIGTVKEIDKQLALELPPGRYRIHMSYWPSFMTLGIVMTLLGLIATPVFFARRRVLAAIAKRLSR